MSGDQLGLYRIMRRIRSFEERALGLASDGRVPGFTHSCIGQEAVSAGVSAVLEATDRVASNHRGHGHVLAKGGDPTRMLAEILGRSDGYLRGMGGELHIMDASLSILGANGIVGAGIPIATGAALADQLARNGRVTVVYFGEGATSEGVFAEALNLASIWRLPVVFVCENNLYAEFTPASETVSGTVVGRAQGHGIPAVLVDGQDAVAVREATRSAVAFARDGSGPSLIEAHTYRWGGHFHGEEALLGEHRYRDSEEVERWRSERDPLAIERRRLMATAAVSESELDAVDAAATEEMDRARDDALASPLPDPEQALEFVFAERVAAVPNSRVR
jgi:TPP-dependent pyruvate/acetoin dehydrogenase alpha subunit